MEAMGMEVFEDLDLRKMDSASGIFEFEPSASKVKLL